MSTSTPEVVREISLLSVGAFLARHWRAVSVCVLLFGALSAVLAFTVHPKYRAELIASPAGGGNGLSDMAGSLGGIAALAGITVGAGNKRAEESIEYLRSQEFTRQFIERHALMPVLYASRWDANRQQWKGEVPTIAQAVKRFTKRVEQITEDRRTGLVTVAIIWRDRNLAAQWANQLVAEADDALRRRAVAELTRSIAYLNEESAKAVSVELRSAVYKAMETELKDAMLARTRDAYAFKVLDPAYVRDADDFDSPNRPLWITLGCGFGLLVGVTFAALRQRRRTR